MKNAVVIGFGSMGRLYCDKIRGNLIPGLSLAGIVCRNRAKYPGVTGYGVPVYSSFDEALSSGDPFDSVIITSPHKSHAGYIRSAADHGLSVLCEKPLSDSLREALSLCELPLSQREKIFMIFNWRQRRSVRLLKEKIGTLGRINHIIWTGNFWYRTAFYHKSNTWRSTWKGEGGGLLINQAQHLLDVWIYLFGMPSSVFADVEYGKWNGISVDDSFEVLMKYDDGKRGVLVSSTIENPGSNRLEVHGENGKLVLDGKTLTVCRNAMSSIRYSEIADKISGLDYSEKVLDVSDDVDEYDAVLRSFASGYGSATLEDGADALMLAAGIYISSWKNIPAAIPVEVSSFEEFVAARLEEEARLGKDGKN